MNQQSRKINRGSPLYGFLPAQWARGPVVPSEDLNVDEVARAVVSAVHFAGHGAPDMRSRMLSLSHIHVAAVLVACYADQACPGDRPWSAGDIISAAAARADLATTSVPRSLLCGKEVHEATVAILESRSEDAAKELTKDVLLLVLEVLA